MAPVHAPARSVAAAPIREHTAFYGLASFAIIVAILYFARVVLVPLAAATLMAFILAPAIKLVERLRVGRSLAVTFVMVGGLTMVCCLGFIAEQRLVETASHWPEYKTAIRSKASGVVQWADRFETYRAELTDVFNHQTDAHKREAPIHGSGGGSAASTGSAPNQAPLSVRIAPDDRPLLASMATYGVDVLESLGSTVLVLTLLTFMLLRWEDARFRLLLFVGESGSSVIDGTLEEATERVSRVLIAQSAINAGFGIVAATGIWAIHATLGGHGSLATAITAGLFCGVLRFVPYVGVWVGAGVPLLFTLAAYPGNTPFYAMLLMFGAMELVTGQWIEPRWLGAQAGLSPVGVLVSALFWTWLWGPLGLLMSTPLAVVLVVVGKHAPALRLIHILLADRRRL